MSCHFPLKFVPGHEWWNGRCILSAKNQIYSRSGNQWWPMIAPHEMWILSIQFQTWKSMSSRTILTNSHNLINTIYSFCCNIDPDYVCQIFHIRANTIMAAQNINWIHLALQWCWYELYYLFSGNMRQTFLRYPRWRFHCQWVKNWICSNRINFGIAFITLSIVLTHDAKVSQNSL